MDIDTVRGKIRNHTGRYVNINGKIGRTLIKTASIEDYHKIIPWLIPECKKKDHIRNLRSGRCVYKKGIIGSKLMSDLETQKSIIKRRTTTNLKKNTKNTKKSTNKSKKKSTKKSKNIKYTSRLRTRVKK